MRVSLRRQSIYWTPCGHACTCTPYWFWRSDRIRVHLCTNLEYLLVAYAVAYFTTYVSTSILCSQSYSSQHSLWLRHPAWVWESYRTMPWAFTIWTARSKCKTGRCSQLETTPGGVLGNKYSNLKGRGDQSYNSNMVFGVRIVSDLNWVIRMGCPPWLSPGGLTRGHCVISRHVHAPAAMWGFALLMETPSRIAIPRAQAYEAILIFAN